MSLDVGSKHAGHPEPESVAGPARSAQIPSNAPAPEAPYGLPGVQAEPGAAYWLDGEHLPRAVPLGEVAARFRTPDGTFREDIRFPLEVEGEMAELRLLASRRGEPLPADYLSDFIQPGGLPGQACVRTGGELARLLEARVPGRLHRDVLDLLLQARHDVAPVRQARLSMALELAIYSALSAAWYFKWAAGEGISLRPRPYEHDRERSFAVLFDAAPAGAGPETYDRKGRPERGTTRDGPSPSPGTPRHPSFPSGHSACAAAASRVLEYFFSPDTLDLDDRRLARRVPPDERHLTSQAGVAYELRLLASNIGEARLWAGVNWRSDHSFGLRLGHAAADCIIAALRRDRIAPLALRLDRAPSAHELEALRRLRFEPDAGSTGHDRIGVGIAP